MKQQEEKKKKTKVLKAFLKLAPVMISSAPIEILLMSIISILHGISWGVQVVAKQNFFDTATAMTEGGKKFQTVLITLLLLMLAIIACQLLNGVGNYIPDVIGTKIGGKNGLRIYRKIGKLSPFLFEDTEYLEDINKAENGKDSAIWFVFITFTIFTFYIPYFTFMGWYLFTLKPILVVAIILVFLPTALTQLVRTKLFAKLEDESAPLRRENKHYEDCIVSREYFKETRLLGGFFYFKRLFSETLELLQKLNWKTNLRTTLIELCMRILTICGYIGILFLLFDALMNREISVGAFAVVFNSIGELYSIMDEVICRHIGTIAQGMGTVQNYLNFLDIKERGGEDICLPEHFDVEMKQVVFSYPGAKEPTIKGVNLTLHDKETLAIVGENGSGKSTMIRLITGLYVPDEGSVTFDGHDTKKISMKSLFEATSAVFQKYQRYQMTLEENISIGDTRKKENIEQDLDKACQMAGVSKEDKDFPKGYQTMLSREFDGVDLSGGEWQRIAIARGFYRGHQMIILDEPTAAIDPYEETRIYNQFAKISKDKTAIIVTHRLGSVKLADRIVVMKKGEIAEVGTHEELILANGEYAKLYRAQEQWYEES